MRYAKLFGPLLALALAAGCASPAGQPAPPPFKQAPAPLPASGASATPAPAPAPPAGPRAIIRDTHIELTGADGSVRQLYPPQTLHLTAGPVWSPDGKWVAVYANTDWIWMVEVATNHWVYTGTANTDPQLTKWDDRWSAWWSEISARPLPQPSSETLTQIRQRALLKIYLPSRLPAGLKLAYINNLPNSDWAYIGFVDASGHPAVTITERPVNGQGPGWIPRQYSNLPYIKDQGGQGGAFLACRTEGECTVAWIAPDPYIQVEAAFPYAMTQADLLSLVASLSPTVTEAQLHYDLPPLGQIAP